MRNLLLSAVALSALSATSAFAADLPTKKAPPPVVVVPFSWTGCYIGAEGGWGWGKENSNFGYPLAYDPYFYDRYPTSGVQVDQPVNDGVSSAYGGVVGGGNFNVSGGKIGGRVGCNYQMNQFVIGGIVDFEWSGIQGSHSNYWNSTIYHPYYNNSEGISYNTESAVGVAHLKMTNNWQGSIRANVGWLVWDRFMIYATGGAAFANIKSTWGVADPCAGQYPGPVPGSCVVDLREALTPSIAPNYGAWSALAGSTSRTVWGWTLGGGAEYAIDQHWFVSGEVRYASFAKASSTNPYLLGGFSGYSGGWWGGGYSASFNEVLAQVAIDYRF